jgi:hypothetical protein
MCFNQPMSGALAGLAVVAAIWSFLPTSKGGLGNKWVGMGVAYFAAMEVLQYFQYFWINDCNSDINKILTAVGYVHICYQPLFTHFMNIAFAKRAESVAKWRLVLRLCALGGTLLLARFLFAGYSPVHPTVGHESFEWLRGDAETLCTVSGKYHLAWVLPLYEPTYFTPSLFLHAFLMFAPFFVMGNFVLFVQGTILLMTGPVLSAIITPNLFEQASIWCFFSIGQILTMLCVIYMARRNHAAKKAAKIE